MEIEQIRKKMVGKEVNYHGDKGIVTNVKEAKSPKILIKKAEGVIDIHTPRQFDIEITFNSGKRQTVKNAQIDLSGE